VVPLIVDAREANGLESGILNISQLFVAPFNGSSGLARSTQRVRPAQRNGKERTSMGIISWIVVGAIAGFLANVIMGAHEGLLRMLILGIVGAVVGGYVAANVLKIGAVDGINVESIVIATIGAIAVIFIARAASGRRSRRSLS
jgi:uncharacterized membrane protein YeaQ/YmgE (transglycosylase-associated protein family)